MAYINVEDWRPDQVTDWLKGLDNSMYNYVHSFTNNEVCGYQLLHIRPYELEQLGMHCIGHQEIVLEAVENLRNVHYNLDKENLQYLALHVASSSCSLHRQLSTHCDASKIQTQILNDITRTIATIKPVIGWLDRAPFQGQFQFTEICRKMLRLGLEMATIAQRDRFAERPVEQIKSTAETLDRLANYIIQDISDPMLLQPSSLNLVTLKKRESELGFNIQSSFHGVHRVTDIKYNSPAHNSGKIEDGDEIIQINYQTVVGWQYKTVLIQLRESLPDVLLTLKKRPKHTKVYGQIYMQPYRLPSKKRTMASRWGETLPSPRRGYLTVPDVGFKVLRKTEEKTVGASSDTDSSCSDILTPTDTKGSEKEIRLYYPKPRAMLQRRNTICGDKLLSHKVGISIPLWHERKRCTDEDPGSPSLRDKSASIGFGLEIAARPTTCIGLAGSTGKFGSDMTGDTFYESKKLSQIFDLPTECKSEIDIKSKPGISKVVRFDDNMKYEDYPVNEKYTCNVENTILETFEPIPFVDDEDEDNLESLRSASDKSTEFNEELGNVFKATSNSSVVEAVNNSMIARRGRLDKSHSTPAYDNSGEESDTPPAIEPRKEFLLLTPPIPPPRPRKQKDIPPALPPPPPKPRTVKAITSKSALSINDIPSAEPQTNIVNQNTVVSAVVDSPEDVNELHTPIKIKTLTLKKKHSLIAKRRNINLKFIGTGDIQGHLYRRTKDRRGVTFWARLYFVMVDTIFYGFRSKEATKASCVIFLPGFTVALAKEVHSKSFAFKVYNSAKTFYFAAESQDALNQWVDFISQGTLLGNALSSGTMQKHDQSLSLETNISELFSETESSGEETESMIAKNLCTPSPQGSKEITSKISPGSKSCSTPTTSTKQDRRYLGSLRKLTKGSLPFKSSSSSEKKPSSDIPVPTEQYRSYRKVPGGSFGIQIGTNTPGFTDTFMYPTNQNLNQNTNTEQSSECLQKNTSGVSKRSSLTSIEDSNSACLGPPSSPAPIKNIEQPSVANSIPTKYCTRVNSLDTPTKTNKQVLYNFLHASNPNLVDFEYQSSKTVDYSMSKIIPTNSWDIHESVHGFITLKDLMLQKQEEEAQEMYNNRVLLGVEKTDEEKRNALKKPEVKLQEEKYQISSTGDKISKTQSRSLPKTPDYEISFKPDDEDIKRTRTKEGLKLRDFGYELISGDEPITSNFNSRHNSQTSNISNDTSFANDHSWTSAMKTKQFLKSQLSANKTKKHSSNSYSSTSSADFSIGGNEKRTNSFKKKSKFESVKTSSERLFQFNKQSTGTNSTGMTMTLPLNKKSKGCLDNGTDFNGIKKSQTYNNDFKDKGSGGKYDAPRKNSAPMPIFSKLTFASNPTSSNNSSQIKVGKEKKLLGSPRLHRTIFGHQQSSSAGVTFTEREYDQEIFSQVILPSVSSHYNTDNSSKYPISSLDKVNEVQIVSNKNPVHIPPHPTSFPEMPVKVISSSSNATTPTPEYPNMECPPVFEPEIYSLSDADNSLTLLLRRNNSNNGSVSGAVGGVGGGASAAGGASGGSEERQ